MGAARLDVVAGNAVGASIVVEDELLIGRHAEGPGQLGDDEEISRAHARVAVDASGFCAIEDLGSTNGTVVNGLRISAPKVLSVGDTIEVGQTTLLVRELPEAQPAAPSETAPPSPADQPTVAPRGRPPTPVPGGPPLAPAAEPPPVPAAEPPPPPAAEPPPPTEPALAPAPSAEPALVPQAGPTPAPEPVPPAEPALAPQAGLTPAPEPVPPAEPALAPAEVVAEELVLAPEEELPPLSLRLEVDFAAREARVLLNGDSEPVRLVYDNGAWHPASSG
jgi:pSer/pThr/pTyr-binding forkhead associated (FHA) protein